MANGWGGARPNSGPKKKPNPWVLTTEERINLLEYCKSIGYDPVVRMVEQAEDEHTPPAMQFACNREVARYIHPTLGRVDVKHSGTIEGTLAGMSLEEKLALADDLRRRASQDS